MKTRRKARLELLAKAEEEAKFRNSIDQTRSEMLLDSEKQSANPTTEDDNKSASEDWRRDKWSIALLLLLYMMQGLPFGLSSTLDLSMQEGAKLTYEEQGIYSSVSWPYSLKMLWAPIVDALYVKKFGRRKTWLIPTQLAIALMLLITADYIPILMGEENKAKPRVWELTYLFFTFFFLCATQDIAVDGWALEMLSKRNIGWASTCNSVGLTVGYTISFQGFIALKAYGLCDFPQFMKVSGWGFLLVTVLLAFFKREAPNNDVPESVREAYVHTFEVTKLQSVRVLIAALLTRSVTFAASETLTTRKLLGMGMKKEMVATVAALLVPISVVLPGILTKLINDRPMALYMRNYVPRMVLGGCSMILVMTCPTNLASESEPVWFWIAVIGLSIISSIISTAQFVALMAFFAKVSDPIVGGSYMTTLNTATNLGSKWPNTVVLFLVNKLTWKDCNLSSGGEGADTACRTIVDGYYVLSVLCLLYGIFWLRVFRQKMTKLERLSEDAWRLAREADRLE